jgi:hypothetical protein
MSGEDCADYEGGGSKGAGKGELWSEIEIGDAVYLIAFSGLYFLESFLRRDEPACDTSRWYFKDE